VARGLGVEFAVTEGVAVALAVAVGITAHTQAVPPCCHCKRSTYNLLPSYLNLSGIEGCDGVSDR
jgi:hypothetical protein